MARLRCEEQVGRVVLALLLQQHPEPVGDVGQRCSSVVGGQLDRPLQPAPPLGRVTMLVPELGQGAHQPQADDRPPAVTLGARGRLVQGPSESGAHVVMLGFEKIQSRQTCRPLQLLARLLRDCGVELGMPAARGLQLTARLEALECVLSNRLEHGHPRLTSDAVGDRDQADVQQLCDLL